MSPLSLALRLSSNRFPSRPDTMCHSVQARQANTSQLLAVRLRFPWTTWAALSHAVQQFLRSSGALTWHSFRRGSAVALLTRLMLKGKEAGAGVPSWMILHTASSPQGLRRVYLNGNLLRLAEIERIITFCILVVRINLVVPR